MPEQSINIDRFKDRLTFWDGSRPNRPDHERDALRAAGFDTLKGL